MEKQVERTQNILKNVTTPKAKQKQNKREWFQSAFDRSRAKSKKKFEAVCYKLIFKIPRIVCNISVIIRNNNLYYLS